MMIVVEGESSIGTAAAAAAAAVAVKTSVQMAQRTAFASLYHFDLFAGYQIKHLSQNAPFFISEYTSQGKSVNQTN